MNSYLHELVLPNEDISFRMFLFEGKDGNYVREKHWHRSVEIFALFEGELEFYINDKVYELKSGDFILVNSNEVHSIHAPKKNSTIVLQIPIRTFEKYYRNGQFIWFSHSSRVADHNLMNSIKMMYETYTKKEYGYELKVQGQFYMLLYFLVTRYQEQISREQIQNYKRLEKLSDIMEYIKTNYHSEISLEILSEIFGYSPTYLSRMFQKYAGTNFKSYLNSIRMEKAYKDLMETQDKIGEIALRHGFAGSKAFAQAFKKQYGKLPGEYRREKLRIEKTDAGNGERRRKEE